MKLQEKMEEVNKLTRQIETLVGQKDDLSNRLTEKDSQILKLSTQLARDDHAKVAKENETLKLDLATAQQKINELQTKLKEIEQEVSEMGTYAQTMRIREVRSLLDELKKRNKQTQLEVNHWKQVAMKSESNY